MQKFVIPRKAVTALLAAGIFLTASCESETPSKADGQVSKKAERVQEKSKEETEERKPAPGRQPPANNAETQAKTLKEIAPAGDLERQVEQVYNRSALAVLSVTSRVVTTNIFDMSVPRQGTGSGFVYDDRGHVVTNYHVVKNARKVLVAVGEDQMMPAEIIGTDPSTDLAVLKVDEDLPSPLALGDSEALRVGQFVVALGNPFGLKRSLTFGVVSALGRVIRNPKGGFISEAIQTDTPINAGNSGGPLLDLKGNVIGINSMIVSPSGANAGVGFAVPSETVRRVVPALIRDGRYPHPWLGIQAIELNRGWVNLLQKAGVPVPVEKGLLVVGTYSGSPAADGDIRGGNRYLRLGGIQIPVGGDVIVRIEDQPVHSYKELVVYLEMNVQIGDTVMLTYYRGDEKQTTRLTVEDRPPLKAELHTDRAGDGLDLWP